MKRNIIIFALLVLSLSFAGCGMKEKIERGVKEGIKDAIKEQDQNINNNESDNTVADGDLVVEDEPNNQEVSDPTDSMDESDYIALVQEDFINFINVELFKVADIEYEVSAGYGSVTGENYSDDYTMYNKLVQEVMPNSEMLVDAANGMETSTKEVQVLRDLYVESASIQHEAFGIIVRALEEQDPDLVTIANEKLAVARDLIDQYLLVTESLAKEVNVELNYNGSN